MKANSLNVLMFLIYGNNVSKTEKFQQVSTERCKISIELITNNLHERPHNIQRTWRRTAESHLFLPGEINCFLVQIWNKCWISWFPVIAAQAGVTGRQTWEFVPSCWADWWTWSEEVWLEKLEEIGSFLSSHFIYRNPLQDLHNSSLETITVLYALLGLF